MESKTISVIEHLKDHDFIGDYDCDECHAGIDALLALYELVQPLAQLCDDGGWSDTLSTYTDLDNSMQEALAKYAKD